jgi:hypothetical protein
MMLLRKAPEGEKEAPDEAPQIAILNCWRWVLYKEKGVEVEWHPPCSRYLEGMVEKDTKVVINTKVLSLPLTGVQRYTLELLRRFGDRVQTVAPKKDLSGIQGQLWEQLVLPYYSKGKLLFSPANTGPLSVARQVVTVNDLSFIDRPEGFNPKFRTFYLRMWGSKGFHLGFT